MMRRSVLVIALLLGTVALSGSPAGAQVGEQLYTGGAVPVQGAVLASSGVRQAVAGPAQPVPLQVSGVAATAAAPQARVQTLALTGTDIASLVLAGLFAVALGTFLTRRGRPRSLPES
jgi:hypothetical protein